MLRLASIFLILFGTGVAMAQPCEVPAVLKEVQTLNLSGDFATALDKVKTAQSCTELTDEQAIELWIWRFKLNRNQLKERDANSAILEAKKLLDAQGKPLPFEFRLLLVESSALRKDTAVYNPMLRQVKEEIFAREPEDHLSKGRYYFLINYEGNDLVPNMLKALQHFEQLDSTPTFHMGIALRVLGNKHRDLGDLDKSEAFYKRELEVYQQRLPEDHFNLSICNYNLGNVYYDKLEYQLALDRYLKVAPVWEQRFEPDHFRMKTLNEAIGDMYWELGDQANALRYFDKATLNEISINNDTSEQTIANADSLLQQGNYSTAIEYYREAVQWREKTYGKQHTFTAACKNFVARAVRSSGDLEGALEIYQDAIKILVPQLKDSTGLANPTLDMEIQSEQYLLEALIAKGELLNEIHSATGNLERLEAALATQELAISVLEKIKNTQISESSKVFWAARTRALIESAIASAVALSEIQNDTRYLEKAFEFAERSKSILLLTSLFDQEISSFSNVPADIISEEKRLKNRINEFSGRMNSEEKRCGQVRPALLQVYRNELQSAQDEHDLFLREMSRSYPDYYELKYDPNIASVTGVQQNLLDTDSALISYFLGEEQVYVFLISESNIAVRKVDQPMQLLAEAQQLFDVISNRSKLQSSPQSSYELFGTLAHTLYKKLLAPEFSTSSHSRITIIPDGYLSYLPFEILISQAAPSERNYKELQYVMKDRALSYSPSASVLLLASDRKNTNDDYLGFAPTYEGQVYGDVRRELSNLKYNTEEVAFATQLFEGKSWTGNDVSEKLLKEQSKKAGILHFAMHGEVEDEHPLLSKLYFSPTEEDDGMLYTYEIYGLDIPSQLVILSACNTATGKLEQGEGILSLERAFQYAGSQSLLSTLWTVDDGASAQLTQNFLQNLKAGEPKDKALQQAKLEFLNTASPDKLHPFYWSSFKLTGNTGVLVKTGNGKYLWWGLGLLMVVAGFYFFGRKKGA